MKDFQIIIAALTSIILFVFSLEHFSKELQKISGEKFRSFLGKATNFSGYGVMIGAVVTALVQSSSATSVIAISLVNAGVLSFKNSVGIIFGSNIGTTVTAQLVAFKLTSFAPAFIILGFLLSLIRTRYAVFAKTLFYFGFVFFSLNLISSALAPLQADARLISFLTQPQNPLLGVFVGFAITALIQSSSVTTGLAVIFTQQGILSLENAIPILMGANIGTTVTALLSIINMDIAAKKTAAAHLLFNVGGVVLFLPIVILWGEGFTYFADTPALALANFHLIFNVSTTVFFLFFLSPFTTFVDRLFGEGKMDFERIDLAFTKEKLPFAEIETRLEKIANQIFSFTQENYNLVTLSIETNFKGVHEAAKKRIDYLDYVKSECTRYFAELISNNNDEADLKRLLGVMNRYEYIFQIHDSIKDLTSIKDSMDEHFIELKSDLLVMIRELSGNTLALFQYIAETMEGERDKDEFKQHASELQSEIDKINRDILKLMSSPGRKDASALAHLVTFSQRLKDKLTHYYKLPVSSFMKGPGG